MKILQVGRDLADTGGGRVVLETSKALARCGQEVKILTDVDLTVDDADGVSVEVTRFGPALKGWRPHGRAGRVLRHFLQLVAFLWFGSIRASELKSDGWIIVNHNIEVLGGDVIVLHNVFSAEHAQDGRSRLRKCLRWLNPIFTLRIARERTMLSCSNEPIVCAVSPATAKEAKPFVSCSRLAVVNNAVNTRLFFPLEPEERARCISMKGAPKQFFLLFVGHEFERKGLSLVIEALALLPESVHLWVIGGRGSSQSQYERLALALGVRRRIIFQGSIVDPVEYYQLADALVLPSAYETWALVGLEAMACGTPALMPAIGGIQEYLNDGENGFFIERNPDDIAQKVRRLMEDGARTQMMRRNCRDTALRFSWEATAQEYLRLFEQVAEERASRA